MGGGLLTGALFVSFAQLAGLYRLPAFSRPATTGRLALAVAVGSSPTRVLFLLKSGADHSRGATMAPPRWRWPIPLARFGLGRLMSLRDPSRRIRGRGWSRSATASNLNGSMTPIFRFRHGGGGARPPLRRRTARGGLIEPDRSRVAQAVA